MRLINHYLAEPQLDALKKIAGKTGLTVSELIRRAIDAYIKKEKQK